MPFAGNARPTGTTSRTVNSRVTSTQRLGIAAIIGGCLLLVGALIFRRCLFGDAVLLYKDIGSDSVNVTYPYYVHYSDYLRNFGLPSWSFAVGMGQDIYYLIGYLLWYPIVWLPKHLIAHALVYQHLVKALLAGSFFFAFLRLKDLVAPAALAGSLLVAFSAYMCMGSCWLILADEVVGFAILLWAMETALVRGRWWVISIAVALIGLIDAFHLYLAALLLLLYVPANLFTREGWRPGVVLRHSAVLAAAAFLGVGLCAVVALPNLNTLLNSPRGSGTASLFHNLAGSGIFRLESELHYLTVAARSLSTDLFGAGDGYRGWANYFEAPLTYCGLLCLLLLPQAVRHSSKGQRIVYGLFIAGLVLPTVFPWFRYLFWGFQGDYYRAYSLFLTFGLITYAVATLSRYIDAKRLNLWILWLTAAVLAGIVFLPIADLQSRLDPALKLQVPIFLAAYALLLSGGRLLRRQHVAGTFIVLLVAVELVLFDTRTVADRKMVTKAELGQRVGYNDQTIEALKDIRAAIGSDTFFRLTKTRPSGPTPWPSLNDAMVFGYYGTSSYASFNSGNYTAFLTAVDAIRANSEIETRWAVGLGNDALLSLFAGERYALTDNPIPFQRALQYEFAGTYDKDTLFRNARFLPLGLVFDTYISEDVFLKASPELKSQILLRTAVFQDRNVAEKLGLAPADLSTLDREARSSDLEGVVTERRKTALNMSSFSQTRIEGTVSLERKGVLVVQTPGDNGWEALQDGRPAPVVKVDAGLLGVGLDAGSHKVELRFRTAFLLPGLAISVGAIVLLVLAAWRWPRLNWVERPL